MRKIKDKWSGKAQEKKWCQVVKCKWKVAQLLNPTYLTVEQGLNFDIFIENALKS